MKLELSLERSDNEVRELFFALDSLDDVANLLEVPEHYLVYTLYRTRTREQYTTFEIPKRSGGTRTIDAPPQPLKLLQAKLNKVFQLVYVPRSCVHGFVPGRSILSNARRHARRRMVFNLDLKDFFPSIYFWRVRGLFMARPYDVGEEAATALAQICCFGERIPQGAPSSPIISNMLCSRLDGQLDRLARKNGCAYTRYADDLTFSTDLARFPAALARVESGPDGLLVLLGDDLISVIDSNDFSVNFLKVRLQGQRTRQQVTGLTVNEFPNVSRRYVRQIRAMLHAIEAFGWEAAEEEFYSKYDARTRNRRWDPPSFRRIVKGKLDFLKMVKGEGDPVYRKLRNKLNSLAPELISYLPGPPADPDDPWSHWTEQYRPLIFHVQVKIKGIPRGGTAFLWRHRALATAAHVLAGDLDISPPFPEGEPPAHSDISVHPREDTDVDLAHAKIDLAVVKFSEKMSQVAREIPVRTEPLALGEEIAVLGYMSVAGREPGLGLHHGRVESNMPTYGGEVDTVQVSCDLSGGLSGGPVIDKAGNLVGIAMESTFAAADEPVADSAATKPPPDLASSSAAPVPPRQVHHILPVRYLMEIPL